MLLLALLLLATAPVVFAQDDCPSIVQAALQAVDNACSATTRNQVCYGNIALSATPRSDAGSLVFEKAGDRANVADIQTLQLSSMSLTDDSWGVALMELQANLADTLPGQNVTFLLFGDVQIDNAVTDASEVTLTTTGNVNVRLRPTTSGNNVMSSLKSGQSIIATGRLEDNSWVRIQVEDDTRGVGWVSADFVQGELNKLAAVEPDAPTWGPMQAFYFKTGIGDRPCAEAPDSGILIQTPKGAGKVTLNANDVKIQLGSTVYLQAQPSDFMTVTVVEGQATLEAGGVSQVVPAGTYSQVQLNAAGKAAGSPSYPQPYDEAALEVLPLGVDVFDNMEIAPALTSTEIQSALEEVANNGFPRSGTWIDSSVVTVNDNCGESEPLGATPKGPITLTFSEDGQTLVYNNGWSSPYTLTRTGDNVYQGTFGGLSFTFTFISSTTYNILNEGIFGDPNAGGCHHVLVGSGVFSRP
jgi:hypothetical protein